MAQTTRLPMKDVIVVIPGITGSVLQHEGRDVWAVSGGAIWGALTSMMRNFDHLVLTDDDPELDDLGDGVTAPRLVDDVHLIPGLWKIDGYSGLLATLRRRLDVVDADSALGIVSNLHPFPYDWRRDNRVAARGLKRLVDDVLPRWRAQTGNPDARVIVVAHSMGGLVASHWAYLLGGVEQCRAIVTFGTPFRGSPQAIQSLSVGVRKFGLDLTDLLRSFTSAYQLLPIYPCVSAGGEWHRPAETTVPGVDRRMAQDALTFHRAILDAAESSEGPYLRPYVGLRQDTTQSFAVDGNAPGTSLAPPPVVEAQFGSGDGTVPQVSAVPVQRSAALVDTSVVERHSVLQNNRFLLDDLCAVLVRLQSRTLDAVRGPGEAAAVGDAAEGRAIDLVVPDLAPSTEPVGVEARVVGGAPVPLAVSVCDTSGRPFLTDETDGSSRVETEVLLPGSYRVVVGPARLEHQDLREVREVLVVVDTTSPG